VRGRRPTEGRDCDRGHDQAAADQGHGIAAHAEPCREIDITARIGRKRIVDGLISEYRRAA